MRGREELICAGAAVGLTLTAGLAMSLWVIMFHDPGVEVVDLALGGEL